MGEMGGDVWSWSAIALFLGPILAAAAIPFFRWLLDDPRRLLIPLAIAAFAYWKWKHPT